MVNSPPGKETRGEATESESSLEQGGKDGSALVLGRLPPGLESLLSVLDGLLGVGEGHVGESIARNDLTSAGVCKASCELSCRNTGSSSRTYW
jgi:hypothetical protein